MVELLLSDKYYDSLTDLSTNSCWFNILLIA